MDDLYYLLAITFALLTVTYMTIFVWGDEELQKDAIDLLKETFFKKKNKKKPL